METTLFSGLKFPAFDGEATFDFFDDFSGTDLDPTKWDTDGFAGFAGIAGYYSVANGLLTTWSDGSTWRILRAIVDILVSDRVAVLTKTRRAGTASDPHYALTDSAGTNQQRVCLRDAGEDGDWDYQREINGTYTDVQNLALFPANTWFYTEICRTGDNSFIARVRNEDWTELFSQSDSQTSWNVDFTPVFWRIRNVNVDYDFCLIRKYVDPEPSHGAWGSEEALAFLVSVSDLSSGSELVIGVSLERFDFGSSIEKVMDRTLTRSF